jgi:hypothetical protein
MPNKYSPPTDQSIIFLTTDTIKADTYNQNITAPDVKLEHLISFLDKNNTNGLNSKYLNAQGVSYQNIAPSSLSSKQIVYSTDFIPTTSTVATVVGTTYTSSAVAISVGKAGLIAKLNLNLTLVNALTYTAGPNDYFRPVFTCGYNIRVLQCDTAGGVYTQAYTASDTAKINTFLNFNNICVLLPISTTANKFIKLELTVSGNPLAQPNYEASIDNPGLGNAAWSLTLTLDPSSTYEIQKSFA